MRTSQHFATVALACASTAAACRRQPQLMTRTVTARVDTAALRTPRTREDSLTRAAVLRADSAAARVDTLVVMRSALRIRAGDSVRVFDAVRVEARDRAGARVPGFAPLFDARPPNVVRLRGGYVVGVAAGEGVLVVRAAQIGAAHSATGSATGSATRVPVTVTAP